MRSDLVELLISGQLYAGWDQVGISRAMDAAAGTFSLSVTDRWSAGSKPWPIRAGDACEVRVGGETVISGYVDMVRPSYSAASRTIQVQGRDKSADLVDCSAVHEPDEWRNLTMLRLAQILGQPFGVKASAEVDVGAPIAAVKLQHGETAMEALVRHGRMRKVLVMPDGKGGILLTRAGAARRAAVELVQGENILSASGTIDWSERFSDYIVKGQSRFTFETDGEDEAHATGSASDPFVTRYRPLIIVTDTDTNVIAAEDRAAWEANTRVGKSAAATITVQGWRQTAGGSLWQPNMLVRVRSEWLQMDGEMLVRQVTFDKGAAGTTTQLEIVSPQAYEVEPPSKKKTKGGANPWMSAIGEDVRRG